MRKIMGVYSILIGVLIIGFWIMLLGTDNVPELETEPISIYFHLVVEFLMGVLLLISGVALLKNWIWGKSMFILANGLLIYSVINSAGYFANTNEWAMVVMFFVILIFSSVFTLNLIIKNK